MANEPETDPRVQLLEKAWASPVARPYMEEAFAKAFPNAEIPGRAMRVATQELKQEFEKEKEALAVERAKYKADRDHEEATSALRKRGYNDDQIKEIEKIMVDEGVGLHANAAILYDARSAPAQVRNTPSMPQTMNPAKAYSKGSYAPYFQGIMSGDFHNPGEEWAREKAEMILADFATNREKAEKDWLSDSYWPANPSTVKA